MLPGHCFTIEVGEVLGMDLSKLTRRQALPHSRKESKELDFPRWLDSVNRGWLSSSSIISV